jgi:hypothetical protein
VRELGIDQRYGRGDPLTPPNRPDRDTHDSMMPIVASESDPISRVLAVHRPQDEAKALRHAVADGFAHAPICQRVALPSFSVLAHGGGM